MNYFHSAYNESNSLNFSFIVITNDRRECFIKSPLNYADNYEIETDRFNFIELEKTPVVLDKFKSLLYSNGMRLLFTVAYNSKDKTGTLYAIQSDTTYKSFIPISKVDAEIKDIHLVCSHTISSLNCPTIYVKTATDTYSISMTRKFADSEFEGMIDAVKIFNKPYSKIVTTESLFPLIIDSNFYVTLKNSNTGSDYTKDLSASTPLFTDIQDAYELDEAEFDGSSHKRVLILTKSGELYHYHKNVTSIASSTLYNDENKKLLDTEISSLHNDPQWDKILVHYNESTWFGSVKQIKTISKSVGKEVYIYEGITVFPSDYVQYIPYLGIVKWSQDMTEMTPVRSEYISGDLYNSDTNIVTFPEPVKDIVHSACGSFFKTSLGRIFSYNYHTRYVSVTQKARPIEEIESINVENAAYRYSNLRRQLLHFTNNNLPPDLRAVISNVSKQRTRIGASINLITYSKEMYSEVDEIKDKYFTFSEGEIFGRTTKNEVEGPLQSQYTYYKNGSAGGASLKRVAHNNPNKAVTWWTATVNLESDGAVSSTYIGTEDKIASATKPYYSDQRISRGIVPLFAIKG